MQKSSVRPRSDSTAWRRRVTAALAMLLIPAVPASAALVFIGTWIISARTERGGPAPVTSMVDGVNRTELRVDMGSTALSHARSTLVATRFFRVTQDQMVELRHAFSTLFSGATIQFKAKIRSGGPRTDPRDLTAKDGEARRITLDDSSQQVLRAGRTYRIKVKITYDNGFGSWNNVSPHTFTVTGV
jgi:hypothetical protein